MTTSQLIARFKNLAAYDLDIVGGALTDDEILEYLNQAQSDLSRRAGLYSSRIPLTLNADTSTYGLRSSAFRSRIVELTEVYISGRPLERSTVDALVKACPNWRADSSGSPTYWKSDGQNLIVYPSPTTSIVSSVNHYVSGYILAPDLNLTTQTIPDIPEELHPHIAGLAVVMAAEPHATEVQQLNRLNSMRIAALTEAELVRVTIDKSLNTVDWTQRGRRHKLWV